MSRVVVVLPFVPLIETIGMLPVDVAQPRRRAPVRLVEPLAVARHHAALAAGELSPRVGRDVAVHERQRASAMAWARSPPARARSRSSAPGPTSDGR